MNLEMLKSFKQGEQVNCGKLFPTLSVDEEIRWTATSVVEGQRTVDDIPVLFQYVEFALDYKGVDMGAVRAVEEVDGSVKWESVR